MIPRETIEREIDELVASGAIRIPPFPTVATRLGQLIGDADFDLKEIVKLVSTDQVLVADALRYANSAFFAGAKPAVSLQAAISRIGIDALLKLTYASSLGKHAEGEGPLLELRRQAWRQGLLAALVCQNLASSRGLSPSDAFTCGLLHDLGQIVAISGVEQVIARHADTAPLPAESWNEIVARHHVSLGVALATRWNLPAAIAEVIAAHHAPPADDGDGRLMGIVRIADHVVDVLERKPHMDETDFEVPVLSEARDRALVAQLVPRLPALASVYTDLPVLAPPRPLRGAAPAPASLVERAETTLFGRQHALRIAISCGQGDARADYVSERIASNGIALRGAAPIPVNRLVSLSLDSPPAPFEMWAKVTRCASDAGGCVIEAQAFALGGEVKRRFEELFVAARAQQSQASGEA